MADPIYFAPLRVPLIDARTGLMSREWYLFFQALWLRSGGVEGQSNDDLLQSSGEGIGTADVIAMLSAVGDAAEQSAISDLQAQVAELTKRVQGLEQNPSL